MTNLIKLEHRIANLESLLLEGKQVGTLYHNCDITKFVKYIIPGDILKASGLYYNNISKSNTAVSFTRQRKVPLGVIDSLISDGVYVKITVDGDKISNRYKVFPYNDLESIGEVDDPVYREQEECVIGPIRNFSQYIKEISIIVRRQQAYTKYMQYIDIVEEYCDQHGIPLSFE